LDLRLSSGCGSNPFDQLYFLFLNG